MTAVDLHIDWVVLTTGERPVELKAALDSLEASSARGDVVVVCNGGGAPPADLGARPVVLDRNEGVPGGRDVGVRATSAPLVGFLDDDAVLLGDAERVIEAFADDERLGVVTLRLRDQEGETSRRHVPRIGGARVDRSGPVANFVEGACVFRRAAYEQVGGYFTDLFYAHEAMELSWRLTDAGWGIRYLADVEVYHPRTEIGRHAEGWRMTGRNRVWIARRTLPWPIALVHVFVWLLLGLGRARSREGRREYVAGWRSGWSMPVERRPITWSAVWRLTVLGRPPIV